MTPLLDASIETRLRDAEPSSISIFGEEERHRELMKSLKEKLDRPNFETPT
jgi:hypothetical protein